MFDYLAAVTGVSSILALKSGKEEHMEMKRKLWADLKEMDLDLYKKIRRTVYGIFVNIPGKVGRYIAVFIYKVAQKLYGFN